MIFTLFHVEYTPTSHFYSPCPCTYTMFTLFIIFSPFFTKFRYHSPPHSPLLPGFSTPIYMIFMLFHMKNTPTSHFHSLHTYTPFDNVHVFHQPYFPHFSTTIFVVSLHPYTLFHALSRENYPIPTSISVSTHTDSMFFIYISPFLFLLWISICNPHPYALFFTPGSWCYPFYPFDPHPYMTLIYWYDHYTLYVLYLYVCVSITQTDTLDPPTLFHTIFDARSNGAIHFRPLLFCMTFPTRYILFLPQIHACMSSYTLYCT